MAVMFCQFSPPWASPSIAKFGASGSEFIKGDDSFTYMILIKKKHYNLDTGVAKSLNDSHMYGDKASSLWFKNPVLFDSGYQLSHEDHRAGSSLLLQTHLPIMDDHMLQTFPFFPNISLYLPSVLFPLPAMKEQNNNFKNAQ